MSSARETVGSPSPNAPVGPVSKPVSKPESTYSQSHSELGAHGERSSPPSDDELSLAKARIAELEEQLKQQQQRVQGVVGGAKEKAGQIAQGTMAVAAHPPGGVPVQVCAALCMITFFLAWFFF